MDFNVATRMFKVAILERIEAKEKYHYKLYIYIPLPAIQKHAEP